ncbi:hypothetical protein [Aminicella lysinilytica]|jgi:amino acid transporter|uniref:Uncharacterized protein n=1 Tax=Aminicella lysinilytica TaxID=433323 RepID=A0A4R6Q341_9FIRM|nr:hypothetical protein [Aminicella lysinilytica]NLD11533.1 hypothetical protein [Clostridiales bacterium]TDP56437.1 hypothetical protein EV211_11411 [Aminicella lysinilytica]
MENYEKYDKHLRYAMFVAYIANILVPIVALFVGIASGSEAKMDSILGVNIATSIVFTVIMLLLIALNLINVIKRKDTPHRKRQIATYIVILVSFIIGALSLILSKNLTSDAALIATGVSYVAYGVANGAFWKYIIDNVRFKY